MQIINLVKNRINTMKTVKIALGSAIAILLADMFGLKYSASAGIIALLTIQNTKKQTILLAFQRVASFGICLVLNFAIYNFFGYHQLTYAAFLLLFIAIIYILGWDGVISTNAVISTHFLMEASMSMPLVINELWLTLIGTFVGVIINMYIPKKTDIIRKDIEKIENDMKKIVENMAKYILLMDRSDYDGDLIVQLEEYLSHAHDRAIEDRENNLFKDCDYHIKYMEMRINQCGALHRIHETIHSLNYIPQQAVIVSEVMETISMGIHDKDNAIEGIRNVENIWKEMKLQPMPKTRVEFENRAKLYHICLELEYFLELKYDFVQNLTEEQISLYWNYELEY